MPPARRLISQPPLGIAGVVTSAALAGVTSSIGGANGGQVIGLVASSAGIGLLMLLLRDLRVRNEELREARAELAEPGGRAKSASASPAICTTCSDTACR